MAIIGRYSRISIEENKKALRRINFTLEQAVLKLGGTLAESPLWCEVMSGRRRDRPDFLKMRAAIELREIDILVTYRVDRLARDAEYGIAFGRLLEQTGVRLYDCQKDDFVDFSNPDDWERYAQQSVSAEAESRKLSSRIRAGKAFGRHQGAAGSKPPWGYIRNPQTERYEIDSKLIKAITGSVKIILDAQNFTIACREIAKKFGKQWQPNSLRIWICNPVLRGHTGYRRKGRFWGEIKYNTHPEHAILSEEQYQKIEKLIAERRQYWGGNVNANKHPLGGLVYCGRCNTKMCVTNGHHRFYFSCRDRTHAYRPEKCSLNRSLPMAELEAVVIGVLAGAAKQIAQLAQQPRNPIKNPRLLELERLLDGLNKLGNNPALEVSKSQIKAEIAILENLGTYDQAESASRKKILESVFSSALSWEVLKQDERRAVFRDLVDRIVVDFKEVEIGISRDKKPKFRIDWSVQVLVHPSLDLPPEMVLLPYVPKNNDGRQPRKTGDK